MSPVVILLVVIIRSTGRRIVELPAEIRLVLVVLPEADLAPCSY